MPIAKTPWLPATLTLVLGASAAGAQPPQWLWAPQPQGPVHAAPVELTSDPAGVPASPGPRPRPGQLQAGPVQTPPAPGHGGASRSEHPEGGERVLRFDGLRLTQSRSADAYLLDIDLNGLDARQIHVTPTPGGILIVRSRSAQTEREETTDDGRVRWRSWSWSSGQRSRRLPVPPDGDLRAMQRQEVAGTVRITIPRIGAGWPDADQTELQTPATLPDQQEQP